MEAAKIRYVAGFMFSPDRSKVVLIRKTHPDWQKGLLNAPGGHVADDEGLDEAMVREFYEETGFATTPDGWEHTVIMKGPDNEWEVHYFKTYGDVDLCKTQTDEEVVVIKSKPLAFQRKIVKDLLWLIPMQLYPNNMEHPLLVEGKQGISLGALV